MTQTLKDSVHKMRDSLAKSLSFSNRMGFKALNNHSNHAKDEMNVFASDIVSKEYILDNLKDVRHDLRILKLEVEDLLIARNHHSFLPVVKAILVTDERPWEYLRFIDTIPASEFFWWQGIKHVLMREYETTIDSRYRGLVTFQAKIDISEGATKEAISNLLKNILQDEDVVHASFALSLFGYSDTGIPEALVTLMDETTGTLKEGFIINVKCGWPQPKQNDDGESKETKDDWVKVLKSCHRLLRHLGQLKQNPQDSDALSMTSAHSVRSEGRNNRQRRAPGRSKSHDLGGMLSSGSAHGALGATTEGRIPRSSRHRQLPGRSKSGDRLPIVQKNGVCRRSVTMPSHNGAIRPPSHTKRSAPERTPSFHMKRPPVASITNEERNNKLEMAPGSKSSQKPRTILSPFLEDDKPDEMSASLRTPSSRTKKPVRRTKSLSQSQKTKKPVRRTQSLSQSQLEHANTKDLKRGKSSKSLEAEKHHKNPDYDWSSGGYVEKKTRVTSSAA